MPRSQRRRNHQGRHKRSATLPGSNPVSNRRAWLSPPIGVVVIVALSVAASFAHATEEIFIAASLMFSLCEGIILALVGFGWRRRGIVAAMFAGAGTAAMAAPARWEVSLLRFGQPVPQTDLLADLLVSIAWGALAGAAGATILRSKLAALMHDDEQRFNPPRP